MVDLQSRGRWLSTTMAGVELLLDQPEALELLSARGGIEALLEAQLPLVFELMQRESLWADAPQALLRDQVTIVAVQLEHASRRLSLHLRWRTRVDIKAVIDSVGAPLGISGHFDLVRRSPSFEHRYFGLFEDQTTHYQADFEGLQLRLDLPEAAQLLEPLGQLETWAQCLHEEVTRVLMSKANRAWLGLSRGEVAAQLRLLAIQASSCDDCLYLHYAWSAGTATVRRTATARLDKPTIVVLPRTIELPPLGEVTVLETDGELAYCAIAEEVELHFRDAGLAHEAHVVGLEIVEGKELMATQAAKSLFDTWVESWRASSELPATVEQLQSQLTLLRVELSAGQQTFCFNDGGAFLGHEVHCERRDGQWQEAFLSG